MKFVVTGAGGFVGGALVRRLVEAGDRVTAIVRRGHHAAAVRSAGADALVGDLCEPGTFRGMDASDSVIIHAAARVDIWGSWREHKQATVDSTANLLQTVLPSSPRRLIYISSLAVYGPQHSGSIVSAERTTPSPPRYNHYSRAKLLAEEILRRRCQVARVPLTILRLGFVYGPGNRPLVDAWLDRIRRDRVFVLGGGTNHIAFLYIDDAIDAIEAAARRETGVEGTFDVASDEPVTQRQYIDALAAAFGAPPKLRRARVDRARAIVWLVEWKARLTARRPPATRSLIDIIASDQRVDGERTRRALNWSAKTPFVDGMQRTRLWFQSEYGSSDETGESVARALAGEPA